jgi:hypothetical protein
MHAPWCYRGGALSAARAHSPTNETTVIACMTPGLYDAGAECGIHGSLHAGAGALPEEQRSLLLRTLHGAHLISLSCCYSPGTPRRPSRGQPIDTSRTCGAEPEVDRYAAQVWEISTTISSLVGGGLLQMLEGSTLGLWHLRAIGTRVGAGSCIFGGSRCAIEHPHMEPAHRNRHCDVPCAHRAPTLAQKSEDCMPGAGCSPTVPASSSPVDMWALPCAGWKRWP